MKSITRSRQIRTFIASSIGTMLEWYDFTLFAYLTPVLSKEFFPAANPVTATMLTYAVFAIGFFVRPIGAIIFGHIGDKYGRKTTLSWSILLMAIPTFLIGLLPTYHTIGLLAPLLLILMRIFQGISSGGESTGATLFVLESVSPKRRGLMGSILWTVVGIGMLLGSFASTLALHSQWVHAWRIPFLLGLLTGIVGYFLRRYTLESAAFIQVLEEKLVVRYPLIEGMKKYKQAMIEMLGIFTLSAMITYLVFIFMPNYASIAFGLPLSQTSMVNTAAMTVELLLFPLAGYISDRYGSRSMMLYGAYGFMIFGYPLFWLMSQGTMLDFVIAQFSLMLLAVCFQGPLNAATFELVPTHVRYSMVAVGYNVSYAIFGGTTPLVATYLMQLTGSKTAPGWYLVFGASIAFFVLKNKRKST